MASELIRRFRQTHSGVAFAVKVDQRTLIDADPNLVDTAIRNIVLNAISFADEGSTIEVFVISKADVVSVSVLNKGPIIGGDLDNCFGPFHSSRATGSGEHHGLGLYLVRLIAEHYGGSATICNLADGSGVHVTITFPTARSL
jgi:signal transduction histidine kinase